MASMRGEAEEAAAALWRREQASKGVATVPRAGRPWADEWQPITYLKRQRGGERDGLYVKARAMEAAKYATRHAVVREEGGDERCQPRSRVSSTQGVSV